VIVEPERLSGDTVNIAARIESFAVPGGVLLSDSACEQIRNRSDVGVVGLVRFKLKNVGRPFELPAGRGDLPRAPELYRQSLAAFEAVGDRAEEAPILSEMAWAHLGDDDPSPPRRRSSAGPTLRFGSPRLRRSTRGSAHDQESTCAREGRGRYRRRVSTPERTFKVGVMLPSYDAAGRTLGVSEVAAYAARAERLGFDSVWASDHFHGDELAPGGAGGRYDPLLALAHLAAHTTSITLGSLVVANGFRAPAQLAREVATLSHLAPGRVVIGLGTGGRASEFETFGFTHERPVQRLRETLTVVPALVAGESVTFEAESAALKDANLLHAETVPPFWVAAFSPRLLELTAEVADGWNTAWYGEDVDAFRNALRAFRDAQERVGSAGRDLEVSVGVRMIPVTGVERRRLADRLDHLRPDPPPVLWGTLEDAVATGTVTELAETVLRYREAGADHVILNLSLLPTSLLDPTYLDRAAGLLEHVR
jgi:alkanesulfonate monooxygenase SsuD/methylene tetrahydromethanopterin reductase-like flavin-dependent oxidoreductase (luciferase family)